MKKAFWIVLGLMCLSRVVSAENFAEYCQGAMNAEGVCPSDICVLSDSAEAGGTAVCRPKPCDEIASSACPEQFCATMVNCRGEEICHFQMFDPPQCGNISYAGQDVPCCDGLVRRCGIAFLDDTCDMYGDHSEYSLPICIPCGDGICTNFENICNCPEDCWSDGDRVYDGQVFEN